MTDEQRKLFDLIAPQVRDEKEPTCHHLELQVSIETMESVCVNCGMVVHPMEEEQNSYNHHHTQRNNPPPSPFDTSRLSSQKEIDEVWRLYYKVYGTKTFKGRVRVLVFRCLVDKYLGEDNRDQWIRDYLVSTNVQKVFEKTA